MAKRQIVSYYPTRDCFRKIYRGKAHYVGKGRRKGETEKQRFERAVAEWLKLKEKIDRGEKQGQESRHAAGIKSGGLDINLPFKQIRPKHAASFAYDYSQDPDELPGSVVAAPADATIDELADAFLSGIRLMSQAGKRAVSTYREAKDSLADFQGFCKRYRRRKVEQIDAQLLLSYRNRQFELMYGNEHSPFTTKRRLRYVKKLVEWGFENEFIESMPRNINGNYAKVELPDPEPKPFTIQQVKQLWKAANTKTKFSRKSNRNALYLLLGLNCGYRSGDIASLRHEHVNWETLVIERKRTKTNSPQIHKLWPLTAELLREEMTDLSEHELMLLDERGGSLVVESIDGKTAKTDCIGRCFNRLKVKIGWKGPGMGHSVLRDTGAQALKDHYPDSPLIVKHYLGHKTRDVVRHYVNESVESRKPLFDAIDWLDGHFGLKL